MEGMEREGRGEQERTGERANGKTRKRSRKSEKGKDPKLKCSSTPPNLWLYTELYIPSSTTNTKFPPTKQTHTQKNWTLFFHETNVQKRILSAASTYADSNPHHYFLYGKEATEQQPHRDHQYICWGKWSQTPLSYSRDKRIKILFYSLLFKIPSMFLGDD